MTVRTKAQSVTGVDTENGSGTSGPKSDEVYDAILRVILDGKYASGERVLIEHLAHELGVGEAPVRSAISRLEADGYLKFARNVGATVSSIDFDLYPETVEAVALIESLALGLAVPNLTTNDIRNAREVNAELRAGLQDLDPIRYTNLNRQFHEILFGACLNRHIMAILEREWALLDTTRESAFVFMPERAAERVEEHDELLDMIEQRRSIDDIERFAIEHRMGTPRRLLRDLSDLIEASTHQPHAEGVPC